jgi:hypothetical protein
MEVFDFLGRSNSEAARIVVSRIWDLGYPEGIFLSSICFTGTFSEKMRAGNGVDLQG